MLLYPSCNLCNNTLGGKILFTFRERLEFLSTRYIARLDKMEAWDGTELAQMGHSMRTYIESRQYKTNELILKLEAVEEKLLKIDDYEEDEGSLRVNRGDSSATG